MEAVPDWDQIIPDRSSSIEDKGVMLWNFGKSAYVYRPAIKAAKERGLDPSTPFSEYSDEDFEWLAHGDGTFSSIDGFFAYLDRKKFRPHFRMHAARYRKYVTCSSCDGGRLGPMTRACKILGKSLPQVASFSIDEFSTFLEDVKAHHLARAEKDAGERKSAEKLMGVEEALEEAEMRTRYLRKIGVGYLSLNRSAKTLSGGELQRINMARCLGSALTGTLYCLDEPHILV